MSAAMLWIFLPLTAGALLSFLRNERWVAISGGLVALFLTGAAIRLPIDTAINFGVIHFRIAPVFSLLGRRLIITHAGQPILVLIYGLLAFWIFGSLATGYARRIVPFGFAITALFVASLSVEPFLYAAVFIEIAVLLAVPLLITIGQPASRGVLRFLIFQTLGVPFILMAGFLLSGVEASPSDLALVIQAATLLGLGFAFLLPVFPFYSWIPMLAEKHESYKVGFVFLFFSTTILLLGIGFLERYTWLRESPQLGIILQTAGVLMALTGGGWAAFQRDLGRLLGYAFIFEIGLSLLTLGLSNRALASQLTFYLIIPRALSIGLWTVSLATIRQHVSGLGFGQVQGLIRKLPFASIALILSQLSILGMPLLAGFPVRQALWAQINFSSAGIGLALGLGTLGLGTGIIRSLAVLVMTPEGESWQTAENWTQRALLSIGGLSLVIFGIFPHWLQPFILELTNAYQRFGH